MPAPAKDCPAARAVAGQLKHGLLSVSQQSLLPDDADWDHHDLALLH